MTNKIIITNDDGIDSPGLKAAVESLINFGEITVIAPTTQQTGTGRGLTGNMQTSFTPIEYVVSGIKIKAYHCDCSPALIVRHALRTVYRSDKPDLVISGINYGENLGANITCSGTVGAALEAASAGVPSIAVSKQTDVGSHHHYTHQDWSATQYFLKYFSQLILAAGRQYDVDVLKIDVPAEASTATEWEITKLSRSEYYRKSFVLPDWQSRPCDGKTIIDFDEKQIEPDSDIHALAIQKIVSVTPLSIDLTSRTNLTELRELYQNQEHTL